MKVLMVSDEQGTIIGIGKPQDVGDKPSGIVGVGVMSSPGQHVHYIDLPAGLEQIPLHLLPTEFRLDLKGESARLVRVQDFLELLEEEKKE